MKSFNKYLPSGIYGGSTGLALLNAGCNTIHSSQYYPVSVDHPPQHFFSWEKGRTLQEYQVIYITKGRGIFESASQNTIAIEAGAVIFLFPGEWHRYKPDEQTGWNEFWIGCTGKFMENLEQSEILIRSNPVIQIGYQDKIAGLYSEIIDIVHQEKNGHQQYATGVVMHLLGMVNYLFRQRGEEANLFRETKLSQAIQLFRERFEENLDMKAIAKELNVGYAWFRKSFKSYTGVSPKQYLLQLKIEQAKTLLQSTDNSVNAIAADLNFETANYFSRQFAKRTGMSPVAFRSMPAKRRTI